MTNKIKSLIYVFCLIVVLVIPYFVFATSPLETLEKIQPDSGYAKAGETTAATLVGSMVNIFFTILGIIFIVLMLYAGYNWMIAAGDNAKVEKAKDTIKRAIIGIIILSSSYAVWSIIRKFLFATI
jgi:hypothetical protein